MRRLTLLLTSPRVAPGLLSWAAWRAVADADLLLCSDTDQPLPRAVTAAGFAVEAGPWPDRGLPERGGAGSVVWLASDEEAERLPQSLAAALVDGRGGPEVEVLHASYDVPGARLLDLVAVMDRLRADCPWDREQTHRSLVRYLLEEAHEAVEAIESGDLGHLREELGDLLLQVVFHSRIAAETDPEEGGFTVDDVAGGIVDKLVYRHPHVFAGLDVSDAEEVDRNWEALKAAEKGRGSPQEGIPSSLPALLYADKVLGRLGSSAAAEAAGASPRAGAEPHARVGDDLLALVARARAEGVDAEQALRDAVRRLLTRAG